MPKARIQMTRLILFILMLAWVNTSLPSAVSLETLEQDLQLPISYSDGCHLSRDEFNPKICLYGDPKSKFTAYLIGDSHAAQWLPGLIDIGKSKKWQIRSMTKSGCPAAFLPMYPECLKWNNEILNEVSTHRPQIVFISNLTNSKHIIEKNKLLYNTYFRNGFSKMIAELSKYSKVKVVEDTPYPNFDISSCVSSKGYGACGFNQKSSAITLITKLTARKYNAEWIPTRALFCNLDLCQDSVNGKNLYRDSSHISGFASKTYNAIFKF
jgi:hypothetical protein